MIVTFLNVGQGDSIILEWEDESSEKIAIIDANLYNGKNPALDFIAEKHLSKIEYIILSHPHYDHYSGLNQILQYCNANSITIGYFLHTAESVPDYLSMASKSAIAEKELQSLFKSLRDLRPHIVNEVCSLQANQPGEPRIPLNSGFSLKILAPTSDERDRYIRKVPLYNEEGQHNNPRANWLSTVIKIESNDGYSLLTSDASKHTLKKIGRQFSHELNGKLNLGQSQHHGSKHTHLDSFWKLRTHEKESPIVISVGENSYGHPDKTVIESFEKLEYKIYATNQVGCLAGASNQSVQQKSTMLRQFSIKRMPSMKSSASSEKIEFTL